jgi:adenylyltransferase/sulfurtransferase
LKKDPHCPTCSRPNSATDIELHRRDPFAAQRAAGFEEMDPRVLAEKMSQGRFYMLLDVRTNSEYDISHIGGSHHIPLSELPQRLTEISRQTDVIVYDKTGVKSRKALEILKEAGFRRLYHLRGGIRAWSEQVDPSLPSY